MGTLNSSSFVFFPLQDKVLHVVPNALRVGVPATHCLLNRVPNSAVLFTRTDVTICVLRIGGVSRIAAGDNSTVKGYDEIAFYSMYLNAVISVCGQWTVMSTMENGSPFERLPFMGHLCFKLKSNAAETPESKW